MSNSTNEAKIGLQPNYTQINVAGEIDFFGSAGIQYGGVSVKNNATPVTINNTTYTPFVSFAADNPSSSGVTPDQANNKITVLTAGVYDVECHLVIHNTAGVGHEVEVEIQANFDETPKIFDNLHNHDGLAAGTSKISLSLGGQAALAAGDYLKLVAKTNSGSTKTIIISDCSLYLLKVGG